MYCRPCRGCVTPMGLPEGVFMRSFVAVRWAPLHITQSCLQVGDTAVTNLRRPIFTLVEDTGPGVHDTTVAACDQYL